MPLNRCPFRLHKPELNYSTVRAVLQPLHSSRPTRVRQYCAKENIVDSKFLPTTRPLQPFPQCFMCQRKL